MVPFEKTVIFAAVFKTGRKKTIEVISMLFVDTIWELDLNTVRTNIITKQLCLTWYSKKKTEAKHKNIKYYQTIYSVMSPNPSLYFSVLYVKNGCCIFLLLSCNQIQDLDHFQASPKVKPFAVIWKSCITVVLSEDDSHFILTLRISLTSQAFDQKDKSVILYFHLSH